MTCQCEKKNHHEFNNDQRGNCNFGSKDYDNNYNFYNSNQLIPFNPFIPFNPYNSCNQFNSCNPCNQCSPCGGHFNSCDSCNSFKYPSQIQIPGPTGSTGPAGPAGLDGVAANSTLGGAIIPFSSGAPVNMLTVLNNLLRTVGLIGFVNSAQLTNVANINLLDISGSIALLSLNFAFVLPRDGTITSLAGFYSNVVSMDLPLETETITIALYSAPIGSNAFTPLGVQTVLSPAFTGTVGLGDIATGITNNISVPVTAQTRLLLVSFLTSTATVPITGSLTGYISAGVNII